MAQKYATNSTATMTLHAIYSLCLVYLEILSSEDPSASVQLAYMQ